MNDHEQHPVLFEHPTIIHDLDDGVLLRVMSHLDPLPDRFNSARCCKRLHHLTNDPRLWLTVTHTPPTPRPSTVYTTLADAVDASHPGDTIVIQPGVYLAQHIDVRWPLRICGAGPTPEHTVLRAPKGVDYAVDFFAAAMMVNLTIESCRSPSVVHSAGRLVLERCILRCETEGLDHLLTPLQTRASMRIACADDGEDDVGAQMCVDGGSKDTCLPVVDAVATLKASLAAVRARGMVPAAPAASPHAVPDDATGGAAVGAGRLIVSECVLQV